MLLFDVGRCPSCEPTAGWLVLSGECGDALIDPVAHHLLDACQRREGFLHFVVQSNSLV